MATGREKRFAPRDRVWLGVTNVQLISTPATLDADAVAARVAELAQAEPGLRFFTRTVPGRPDRYVDASTPAEAQLASAGLIAALPGHDIQEIADSAAQVLDADEGVPVPAIYTGHGVVGHRFPHVFGDGLSAITHLRRLGMGPDIGSKRSPWPIPGVAKPLWLALRERYGKAPRQLLADLRMERPENDPAPAVHPDGDGPAGAGTGPQRVNILFKHLDGEVTRQLKDWRKQHAPGASTMSILVAAIRRGLAEQELIPATDGMYMAYDLRSYLPKGAGADGNFISVSYIKPGDPLSAVSVNETVRATMESRRPLLGLAAAAARLSGRRSRLPQMPAPATTRTVAFSHMRVSMILPPDMLAQPGEPAIILAASTPSSVGSLTFTFGEIADQVSITAVFCAPFTSRARLARVLDDLAKDPLRLLGQSVS